MKTSSKRLRFLSGVMVVLVTVLMAYEAPARGVTLSAQPGEAAALLTSLLDVKMNPQASDTTEIWRIETVDGNEFFGHILERTETHIRIRTEALGEFTIPVAQIRRIEIIEEDRIVDGELWADNPQSTRYFWGPNGYGLKEGEGYYQNVWVFFNQVSFGLTDNTSIGLGIVPLFLFDGTASPIWITPKVSLPLSEDKVNLGAGALLGTVAGEGSGAFGITYGTLSFGSRDKNFTFGLGYGFAEGQWGEKPAIYFSGMSRVGKRSYFITENYLIDSLYLFSIGGRFIGGKVSFDYGLVIPYEPGVGNIEFALPWVGIVVPIGERGEKLTPGN